MARLTSSIALVAATLGIAACGGSSEAAPHGSAAGEAGTPTATAADEAATVTIEVFDYEPDPLVVRRGTQVTWVNRDDTTHTVTSGTRERRTERFDEQLEGIGARASHRFTRKGTYRYFCTLHPGPGMTAKVVVR